MPNLNLIGRSTGEQAVIVVRQAVANYPNSSDFVRAVERRIPGLANYLHAAAQPLGCEAPTILAETASMDTETKLDPAVVPRLLQVAVPRLAHVKKLDGSE